jgi:cell division protein FtsQ
MSLDQPLSRTRGRRRPAARHPARAGGRGAAGSRRRTRRLRLQRPNLRAVLALLLAVAMVGGGWLWLRDSSLVQVRDVQVTGASSSAEPRIRAALETAARQMTTLHVREEALRRSVAGFPSVASLHVRTDFPHRLVIEVAERQPVAVISSGTQRMAATGGGLLLRDVAAPDDVPVVAAERPLGSARAVEGAVLGALAVADAAPRALRARTSRITVGPRGLTAELVDGPPLIFGTREDAAAKWAAAARVLADPTSVGATYLDLRVRGRVAAGGIGPVVDEPSALAVPGVPASPTPNPQP